MRGRRPGRRCRRSISPSRRRSSPRSTELPVHPGPARFGQDVDRRAPDRVADRRRQAGRRRRQQSQGDQQPARRRSRRSRPPSGVPFDGSEEERRRGRSRSAAGSSKDTNDNEECETADVSARRRHVVALRARRNGPARSTTCSSTKRGRCRWPTRSRWAPPRATSCCSAIRSSCRRCRQGVHPGDVGCSVLEHLLAGAATVPADRGLFLARTGGCIRMCARSSRAWRTTAGSERRRTRASAYRLARSERDRPALPARRAQRQRAAVAGGGARHRRASASCCSPAARSPTAKARRSR